MRSCVGSLCTNNKCSKALDETGLFPVELANQACVLCVCVSVCVSVCVCVCVCNIPCAE